MPATATSCLLPEKTRPGTPRAPHSYCVLEKQACPHTVPSTDQSQGSGDGDRGSMSHPAPSPPWIQLQVHLFECFISYLEGHHGMSTTSQVPALPVAPGVLLWGCRVKGQCWGRWGGPWTSPPQLPQPP